MTRLQNYFKCDKVEKITIASTKAHSGSIVEFKRLELITRWPFNQSESLPCPVDKSKGEFDNRYSGKSHPNSKTSPEAIERLYEAIFGKK